MRKKILNSKFVVGLFFSSLFFVACGGSPEWALYDSQEGSYKAEYPGKPNQETDKVSGVKLDIAEVNDTAFSVAYYITITENIDLESSVKDALQAGVGATADQFDQLTVSNYPCSATTASGKSKGENMDIRVMICKTDSMLYIVQAIGIQGQLKKEDVDRFMNSFQILDNN